MTSLFALKEWLSLEEAAEHLGRTFTEPVSVADVLKLATNGRLQLSVSFVNHARARLGKRVPLEDVPVRVMPSLKAGLVGAASDTAKTYPKAGSREEQHRWLGEHKRLFEDGTLIAILAGECVDETGAIVFEREVQSIDGIWDIPDFGAASLDVEHRLQMEVGGPEVTLGCLSGTVVVAADGTQYAWIMEHWKNNEYASKASKALSYDDPEAYYPAGGLPNDSALVVRTAEIGRLLRSMESAPTQAMTALDRGLDARERVTLLCAIGALARMAGVELTSPYAAGKVVSQELSEQGVTVGHRALGDHFKLVADALQARTGGR